LLTPPDGGVAAVDEAIDGGAPPGATFATTTFGVGVNATVNVDDDDILASATAIDTLSSAITATIVSTVNKAVTAAVTAAIEASLGDAIVVAIRSVRAEIASNHGHVTKRLFPKLDDKITTLASTVESKGESLLTKITSVDTLVGGRMNSIEGRLATLESKLETTMKSTQGAATSERTSGREPPNDPPPAAAASPRHMGAHAGGYVDAGNTPATADVRAMGPVPLVVCDDDASVASVTNNANSYDSLNATERSWQAFASHKSRVTLRMS
jgi:hypothetical protein